MCAGAGADGTFCDSVGDGVFCVDDGVDEDVGDDDVGFNITYDEQFNNFLWIGSCLSRCK